MANTTGPTGRQPFLGPIDRYSFRLSTRQMVRDAKDDDSDAQAVAELLGNLRAPTVNHVTELEDLPEPSV